MCHLEVSFEHCRSKWKRLRFGQTCHFDQSITIGFPSRHCEFLNCVYLWWWWGDYDLNCCNVKMKPHVKVIIVDLIWMWGIWVFPFEPLKKFHVALSEVLLDSIYKLIPNLSESQVLLEFVSMLPVLGIWKDSLRSCFATDVNDHNFCFSSVCEVPCFKKNKGLGAWLKLKEKNPCRSGESHLGWHPAGLPSSVTVQKKPFDWIPLY